MYPRQVIAMKFLIHRIAMIATMWPIQDFARNAIDAINAKIARDALDTSAMEWKIAGTQNGRETGLSHQHQIQRLGNAVIPYLLRKCLKRMAIRCLNFWALRKFKQGIQCAMNLKGIDLVAARRQLSISRRFMTISKRLSNCVQRSALINWRTSLKLIKI